MKTLRFSVPGDNDLAAINAILSDQEMRFCEFLDSKIAYIDNEAVNLVTFNQYDAPSNIKELILKDKSEGPPPNGFWEGVMVVNKNLAVVLAGRAN